MIVPSRVAFTLLVAAPCLIARPVGGGGPGDWPQFRGPGGAGVAERSKLPPLYRVAAAPQR